jgi:hypothetical protein
MTLPALYLTCFLKFRPVLGTSCALQVRPWRWWHWVANLIAGPLSSRIDMYVEGIYVLFVRFLFFMFFFFNFYQFGLPSQPGRSKRRHTRTLHWQACQSKISLTMWWYCWLGCIHDVQSNGNASFGSWEEFHCRDNATNRIFVFLKIVFASSAVLPDLRFWVVPCG